MLRIALFIATNIAILLIFSIAARIFGLDQWVYQATGTNYGALLVWCAMFGFGGSIVSLLMSKMIAKRTMGVQVIDQPQNQTEAWLLETVRRQSEAVGIKMPEVGIFPDHAANAFATGASRNSSLVAVSKGLLQRFDEQSVEAVIGHEIAHVANGDMVTMSLLQGVLNTFVLLFSRIVGNIVDRAVFKNEDGNGIGSFLASLVAQVRGQLVGITSDRDGYLYVTSDWVNHMVIRITYDGLGTAVWEQDARVLLDGVTLSQNYPNPFNPETTIRYDLSRPEAVELSVYNLEGQKVATLVLGHREAGSYSVRWDGVTDAGLELASGVYFYRLTAGERVETRKLLLLR